MAKNQFRKSQYDAPVPPAPKEIAPTYVPILNEHGSQVGHVHGTNSEATVNGRFGIQNAKLKKINGQTVWQGQARTSPSQRRAAVAKLTQQRVIAKGSVTRSPTKPSLARRPERGG